MSQKSISLVVIGTDEDTSADVNVSFTVDYIEKMNVYLKVGDTDPIAITNSDMRKIARFVTEQMQGEVKA